MPTLGFTLAGQGSLKVLWILHQQSKATWPAHRASHDRWSARLSQGWKATLRELKWDALLTHMIIYESHLSFNLLVAVA